MDRREDVDMRRVIVFAVMLLLCAAAPATAQECQQGTADFRLVLEGFVSDLYALSDTAAQLEYPAAADLRGSVVKFDLMTAELGDDELDELCAFFERTPSLTESTDALIDALELVAPGRKSVLCWDPELHNVFVWIAFGLELTGHATKALCDIAGCTKSMTFCVISCVADMLVVQLGSVANFLVTLDDDACHQEHGELLVDVEGELGTLEANVLANQNAITTGLDVPVSTRATQGSVDGLGSAVASIDLKLGGGPQTDIAAEIGSIAEDLSDQQTDRQFFQELELRLSIEEATQPGQSGLIALLQLPESMGGRLEQVREVVASTITMHQDAGQGIQNALHYFGLADACFNTQSYEEAFTNYRQAYQEAMRSGYVR
jgi:hypothetical protein